MERMSCIVFFLLVLLNLAVGSRNLDGDVLGLRSEAAEFIRAGSDNDDNTVGTRWAVLIAGSNGYWNYRHQADVCHAYQILRKGGLKDENIIVFMYDDIAFAEENPRPGVLINSPHGSDVYEGVPKDYVGDDVNVNNFLAVILGNKTSVKGGSGKVVDSSPNDHIFIYYTDHGAAGMLGMPTQPFLFGDDIIRTLLRKHALGTYKRLVFYIEACESGSIFEGFLPEDLNIYATTASNAEESSYGTYCPDTYPSPPPEYDACLGDLYSVAWMEDSELHNLRKETLEQQYEVVKRRTLNENFDFGSHVMQYGNVGLGKEHLSLYMGTNHANDNYTSMQENSLPSPPRTAVNQRDADLNYFWPRYLKAPVDSPKKVEALKELHDLMSHRHHIDQSMNLIGKLLFGTVKGAEVLKTVRSAGQRLVDDWHCLKTLVRTYETYCGSLSRYGMKYLRSLANFCNSGIQEEQMSKASAQACLRIPQTKWSSLHRGFSA